eukprot:c1796_g1_i1.p1 GENE.c1796_g1_i1~~c1796_g1_i1.p1  ORF type:complete len:182 (+),score=42.65 c1796_g1_i1:80-625(+)
MFSFHIIFFPISALTRTNSISSVKMSGDHSMIVATCGDTIHVLQQQSEGAASPKPVHTMTMPSPPLALCIDRNNQDFYVSRHATLYLYSIRSTQPIAKIDLEDEITSASLAPPDAPFALLCVVGHSTLVMIARDKNNLVERKRFTASSPSPKVLCVTSHPKEPLVCAVGTDSGRVYVCNLK